MVMYAILWAPVALRVALGAIFIVHGYPKLFKDFKGTAKFLESISFKPGAFWALVLGVAEFFGGLAILGGIGTRVAAGVLIISMVVATLLKIFKWKTPFTTMQGMGWEFDLLILVGLIALLFLGSGELALNQLVTLG